MKLPIYPLTKILFIQYIIVTLLMMLFYSGGNRYAPELTHFVMDQNYLSDLGRSITYAGKDNPGFIFYSLTLALVGIGTLLFFIQIMSDIKNKLKYLVLTLALTSTIGYIGIAWYPANESLDLHVKFARLGFFGFFFTTVLTHILLDKPKFPLVNKLFYILNTLMFLYLLLIIFGPSSSQGQWALQIKTIAQKSMVYSQLIICLVVLRNIKTTNSII